MSDHDPSLIRVMTLSEAVRKRPHMYLPMKDPNLANLLLREALCCARDDALEGKCDAVWITLHPGGRAVVKDNGPGLPLKVAEAYMTSIAACANGKPPEVAATTCTIGLAVLNVVTSDMLLRVFTGQEQWRQHYRKGEPVTKFENVGVTSMYGTEFAFSLDPDVIPNPEFDFDEFVGWFQKEEKNLHLTLEDLRTDRRVQYSP